MQLVMPKTLGILLRKGMFKMCHSLSSFLWNYFRLAPANVSKKRQPDGAFGKERVGESVKKIKTENYENKNSRHPQRYGSRGIAPKVTP